MATAKLPGPSDLAAANSPATPMIRPPRCGAPGVGLDRKAGRDQRRAGAAHGGDLGHQRMAVGDARQPRAVADKVGRAGQRHHGGVLAGIGGKRLGVGSAPASAANSPALSRTTSGARPTSTRANAARGGARSMKTGSSTQGTCPGGGLHRDLGGLAALAVEGAEIDQQRIGARDEGRDLLRRQRHRGHAAGSEQHIGGEVLCHGIGDAVHLGRARAQALEQDGAAPRHVAHLGATGGRSEGVCISGPSAGMTRIRFVGLALTASQPGDSGHPTRLLGIS